MPDSENFSVCSFLKNIYLIGGYLSGGVYLKVLYKYKISHNKWTKIADLNVDRSGPSCAVFEGKIVATGGHCYTGRTKSSESYNHHENKWNRLPDMIGWRDEHSSFSMGNKFFVIGGFSNIDTEVFDSTIRKFTSINLRLLCKKIFLCDCEKISISRKMFVFCSCSTNKQPMLHVYNLDDKRWVSKETVESVRFRKPINHKVPKQWNFYAKYVLCTYVFSECLKQLFVSFILNLWEISLVLSSNDLSFYILTWNFVTTKII